MSLLSYRRARWAAPVAAIAAIGGAVAVAASTGNAAADAHPPLPARTAGELLAALQGAHVDGLSGTVVQTSRLGLPELPGASNGSSLSPQSFASGSRSIRVWAAGEDRQRIALLGSLDESEIVRSGRDLWTYTSATRAVTHVALPEHTAAEATPSPAELALTPTQAAQQALQAIDPTTAVTVDVTASVAGRSAYQLVLSPRDDRSLVGQVKLALDSETSLPLRVQVFAAGSGTPALQVGFTELSLAVPGAGVFGFTPPKGSTVTEKTLPAGMAGGAPEGATAEPGESDRGAAAPADSQSGIRTLGKGWTSVLVIPAQPDGAAAGASSPLLDKLTTPVAGGRLITSSLVSVLLADDGTVYIGAVRGADLQKVAATGQGL